MHVIGATKTWETRSKDGKVEFPTSNDPEVFIARMDKYKVDMAVILPESGWGKTHIRPISTNGLSWPLAINGRTGLSSVLMSGL